MNNDEYIKVEDRAYINPTLSSSEQEAFIDNLRDIQSQANQQIQEDTYNLGSELPSNLGGLGAGDAYFTSRYQVPQTNEAVATLKAAAQAQALQDVMENYNAQLQNQYKQAYRKAQARQRALQKRYLSSLYGGDKKDGSGEKSTWDGDVTTTTTDGATGKGYFESFTQSILDKIAKNPKVPPKESDYITNAAEYNKKIEELIKKNGGTNPVELRLSF